MPYLTRPGQVRYKIMIGRRKSGDTMSRVNFFLVLKLPGDR